MSKNSSPKTPFQNFTRAAQAIFNLSKSDVKKVQEKTPAPRKRKKK